MRNKKFPIFYICLLVLVLVVIVGTEIGKVYLTDVLEAYENSQYKHVAEDFLESHFTSGNGETLAELFRPQMSKMESDENAAKTLAELTNGKTFSLQSVSTGLTDKIEYVIKCDDKRFASLALSKGGETDEFGFAQYTVSEVLLNENLFFTRSVSVPVGYTVFVNGIPADASYCLGNSITTTFGDDIPGNIPAVEYTTYSFANLLSEPSFEVLSANGIAAPVTLADNGEYYAEIVFDTEMPADLQAYAIEATKAYACYLQKDAGIGAVAKYMDKSSLLYENIRTSPNWMVINHNSYDFADAEVTEYYIYNDNAFSCRVTLTHILKYKGLQDYRDYIDITWFFTLIDGKYLIYDSFNNN